MTPLAAPLPTQYLLMALVGVVAGAGGPLFLWLMTATGHAFRSLRLKPPLQLALGGLIVGLLSLLFPQVWGNGYSVVQALLIAPPGVLLLGAILVCKLLAIPPAAGRAHRAGSSPRRCSSAPRSVRSSVSCLACGRAWIRRCRCCWR